jgi:hypothetical protein
MVEIKLKKRVENFLDINGYYYNSEEVMGHITAFDSNNYECVLELDDYSFMENVENALSIIDLNDDMD